MPVPSTTNTPPRRRTRPIPRSTRPSAANALAAGSVMHSASASASSVWAIADSDAVTTTSCAPEPCRRRPSSRSMSSRGPGSSSDSSRARTTGAPAASASRSTDAPPAAVRRSGSSGSSSRGIRRVPDLLGLRVGGLLRLGGGIRVDRVHGGTGGVGRKAKRGAGGFERPEHLGLDACGRGDHLVGLALLLLGGGDDLRGLLLGVDAHLRRDVLGAGLGLVEVGTGGVGGLFEQALTLAMDLLDLEVGRGANRGQLILDEGVERTDGAVDGVGQPVEVGLGARSWCRCRRGGRRRGGGSRLDGNR